jgi:hypothetical protein
MVTLGAPFAGGNNAERVFVLFRTDHAGKLP